MIDILCFYSKQVFGTHTAKSQPICIKFCTHLLYAINLWADLDCDQRVGGSRPNRTTMFFVILVTHPKCYIETTDHCDFGGKPSKWRWGRVISWKNKIPEFCGMGGARSKNKHFFTFLGYPSTVLHTAHRKQFYPRPMVPMESRDSGGLLIASLESL